MFLLKTSTFPVKDCVIEKFVTEGITHYIRISIHIYTPERSTQSALYKAVECIYIEIVTFSRMHPRSVIDIAGAFDNAAFEKIRASLQSHGVPCTIM